MLEAAVVSGVSTDLLRFIEHLILFLLWLTFL